MHPKHLLAQYGFSPKKSLGQNFLFDDQVLGRIAGAAGLQKDDQVLEIGPGLGALTRHLAERAGRVVAIELDDRLLPILESELSTYPNVVLVHGDILEADPAGWFGNNPYKVVANVPYYITGAILRHLLTGRSRPTRLVLTVQKEVAQRLTAGQGEMSLLAVSVQFYGAVEIVGELKAGTFWPRPDVDSAIVRVDVRPEPLVADEEAFFRLVRAGFSQKRKQLQKNLRGLGYGKREIRQLMETAGIDPKRRAETLSLAEWKNLFELIEKE